MLEPAVKDLRYSDGIRGGTLGLMYNLLLQLDELYSSLVERLVCTHTNLQFEHRLELYEADMLPWDLEMTVEESLSDDEDEDGVPHCVSDSESESENESD